MKDIIYTPGQKVKIFSVDGCSHLVSFGQTLTVAEYSPFCYVYGFPWPAYVTFSTEDGTTINSHASRVKPILWAGLLELSPGDFVIGKDGEGNPLTFPTHEEATLANKDDKTEFQEQILSGEREPDEEYLWEVRPVCVVGPKVYVLDNGLNIAGWFYWA